MFWHLNVTGINWYGDGGEYLLYAEEAGETLLLGELGYTLIGNMLQHPKKAFSDQDLAGFVSKLPTDDNRIDRSKQITVIMQSLLKMHLVKVAAH